MKGWLHAHARLCTYSSPCAPLLLTCLPGSSKRSTRRRSARKIAQVAGGAYRPCRSHARPWPRSARRPALVSAPSRAWVRSSRRRPASPCTPWGARNLPGVKAEGGFYE
eukprot:scaffold2652_cov40-Phaeocystis_antarctica.AAC.2